MLLALGMLMAMPTLIAMVMLMAMQMVLVMAIHPLTCGNAIWDLHAIHHAHGNWNAIFPVELWELDAGGNNKGNAHSNGNGILVMAILA